MVRRLCRLLFVVAIAGCAREPGTAATAAPPTALSGIDRSAFDLTVRPQDDLFGHVNGAWLATTEIPADKSSYGTIDRVTDQSLENLKAIAEDASLARDRPEGSDAQKIGDFYQSFMNETRVDELAAAPLAAEMAAIDAIRTKSDLARYFARAFMLNVLHPLAGYVDGDSQDPGTETLTLYQSGLGLPDRDYYFKAEAEITAYRDQYVEYLATLLTLAGQPTPDAAAREIFALETRLARAHWTNVQSRDAVKTYNRRALADLPREFPGFDWVTWAASLGVDRAPWIVVAQPSYVKAFAAAVRDVPLDQWKPYLRVALISGFAPFLSKPFVDAQFGFYGRTLRGMTENRPRWKRAVTAMDQNLGELLGKLYVERHFAAEAKTRVEQLVEHMRTAFRDGIEQLEWMGPDTKRQAQEKLARFRAKIGYPARWRDYSRVQVVRDDLVGNVMRAYVAENEYQLGKVGKPVDPEEWVMTPPTVNAYYNPVRNEIVFPAGILQPPFFDVSADDAVNYGGIGAVIGHEMGHGFDDQGRRYDATGALRDWWAPADAEEYTKRAAMLVSQYGAFEPLPGLKVNGELTLGENIGDLTGAVIAHRAYRLALAGRAAPVIDGLSGDERFFFGLAQVWRRKMRDPALRQMVLTNPHSPAMYRANGPVRNMSAFYDAFGVKAGDALFLPPDARARIW